MRRKYVLVPQEVEALRFDGENGWEVSNLLFGEGNDVQWRISFDMMVVAGDVVIQKGMWVVKQESGGYFLMNDYTFHKNYAEVEA
jgi:hypothetical protein